MERAMDRIYEVRGRDFTNEDEAIAYAASIAGTEWACIITFLVYPNLPGLKPDLVHKSVALRKVFADGRVVQSYTHGP
jgi:hypothetical protein